MDELTCLEQYFCPEKLQFLGYLTGNRKFIFENKNCIKEILQNAFDINMSAYTFYSVVNGEGNEKNKIDTFYSSSLQTLLFFAGVNDKNRIIFDNITYTEAYFEVKNQVIGSPSSIDVALVSADRKNILFIETKLYEVIRDSRKNGTAEVGVSYFDSNKKTVI